ncbi:protein FAM184A isoform X2 [Anoplophora glabripennis]|uniref:protein FAM184A isoform X2 n=1 Tax=Anoplophora glabripennis TaxID=217634 RepID=UPI000874D882|nr:protein FAM184A isoform X2 [Anoplophora glabripennis]
MSKMFSFFRKSKKDDRRNRDSPPQSAGSRDANKNNHQKPEIAPESVANYSSEVGPVKNATNAPSPPDKLNEKIDSNSRSANPEPSAVMCDDHAATLAANTSYASMLKKPEPVADRRGSGVKPCGHGTTAIAPWVAVLGHRHDSANTPPASPVLEAKKALKVVQNGVDEKAGKEEKDTVTASMKLHVNLPITSSEKISAGNGVENQVEKKNLINQEAKFQSQLNDLSKELSIRDAEATKLRFQMEELQRDVFAKSAGIDRLQTELNTANKECEVTRQRIRQLESDLENYRAKHSELSEQLSEKSELLTNYEKETKAKIGELEGVVKELRDKIENLENELNTLGDEKVKLEERHAELSAERDEEKKKVSETVEQAIKQKQEIEKKWKEDFEKLRTINILKEQQLLDDFEWKLREVQQTCKKRLEDKDKDVEDRLQEAYKEAEMKMRETEEMMEKIENLKIYQTEVEKLRNITIDQERAMRSLLDQQEQMTQAEGNLKNETKKLRTLIDIEKENIQHIQRIHHQELVDKERKLQQTLDEKRTEIAMYWEERLLHECGRLKSELEQIHNEEKWLAMESVRKKKDEDFQKAQNEWEQKLRNCLKEVASLKKSLVEKDEYYREELVSQQTNTDRDIMELRRLMDKIDMSHHNKYEKVITDHESELERINEENEKKLKEAEVYWQNQVSTLRATVELVKEQMEKESQQKIETLIQQHRTELDAQWENLIQQKGEAIELLEEEYVTKYKTLEEQFYMQQKSHSVREIELLKTIDSLKNELQSKESTIDDLQNNVDTLEGGVQVLNQEIAQNAVDLAKTRKDADHKIRFEEVRQRYERRESRQEDLTTIADLKQIIAEQEKDLACINEEKRYFQMRLMSLEKHLEEASAEEEEFEDARAQPTRSLENLAHISGSPECPPVNPQNGPICIPPTIPECDDCDE